MAEQLVRHWGVSGDFTVTETSPPERFLQALRGAPTPKPRLFRADHPPVPAKSLRPLTGEAPSRRVTSAAGKGVGTCAGSRRCTRLAPLACYTCAAFRPWRDAPHEDLLRSLIEERATLLADGISPQVAGANDATIMAVAEVADRCRAMRTGTARG